MKRILVIDDEPLQLELIIDRIQLEFSDIEIDKALNINQAKQLLEENTYSIVVTDLLMQDQNTKEEIHQLSRQLKDSYIVVYTVEPEAFPLEYTDGEKTFVVDKMKPFEEGIGALMKRIFSRRKGGLSYV